MLDLKALSTLLSDPELRQKLTQITSAKIKADIKSLQANSELSRHLLRTTMRSGSRASPVEQERTLSAIVSEHLDYFATLTDLSAAFSDRLLAMLAALDKETADTAAPSPVLTMNLKGPLGSTIRAPFEIENNRDEPVTAIFRLTPYVSEDGAQLVAANHAFDPPQAVVPKGGKLRVMFVQPVDGFTQDRDYLATISVEGMDAMQIVVHLHVEPPVHETEAAPSESVAEPRPASRTRSSKAKAKTGERKKSRPAARSRGTSSTRAAKPKSPPKKTATARTRKPRGGS